nr:LuxR C-terminal-related transcriptional regulator [uncultured Macellibacteroides sp.]
MKTTEDQYLKYPQMEPIAFENHVKTLIQCFEVFSATITQSFYVIDIQQERFCYIKPDDLFLCGSSVEDAQREGYGFYSKIVYPKDLSLWITMLSAVLKYLNNYGEKWDEIDYFSCTFRLQRNYSFLPKRPVSQMVYHRMKHILQEDKLRYLICSVGSSTIKNSGNLRMYNNDGLTYEEYNYTSKRWTPKTKNRLTEREKAILMLAQQGKSSKEIANDLCKGENTIRNQIKPLFSKLNVHSMQEAIEFACYHRLISLK